MPSLILMMISVALFSMLLTVTPGEVFRVGGIWFGEHWLPLAVGFFSVGYQGLLMGVAANKYTKAQGFRQRSLIDGFIDRFAKVDFLIATAVALGLGGLAMMGYVVAVWSGQNFGELHMTKQVTLATTLIVASFQTLFGAFLMSLLGCDD